MFLNSIISAFNVMKHWEIHVVGLGYLIFLLIPVLAVGVSMGKKQCSGLGFRCITILLLPALQVIAVVGFILIVSPIMLGMAEDASWGLPWKMISMDPALCLGLLGCLLVVSVALVFIPGLGRLYSFRTLVLGSISLMFVQKLLSMFITKMDLEISYLVPGFWFITGVVFIAGVLSKFDLYFSGTVAMIIENKFDIKKGVIELAIFPVASVLGFIPVFIYGAWLA